MIYLDSQTLPYLERKFKTVADSDFIGKRVQGLLKAERERLQTIENCEHENVDYTGEKNCCQKCTFNTKKERWTRL